MGDLINQLQRDIEDNAQPREEVIEIGALWSRSSADQTDPDLLIPR